MSKVEKDGKEIKGGRDNEKTPGDRSPARATPQRTSGQSPREYSSDREHLASGGCIEIDEKGNRSRSNRTK